MIKKQKIITCLILLTACFLIISLTQAQTTNPEIILTWSADTYIPPTYPGRALPVKDSFIEAVGLIEGIDIDPKNIKYYWYLDGRLQAEKSGQGRQIFKFKVSKKAENTHQVKLWTRDKNENLSIKKTIEIKIVSPQVYIKGKSEIKSQETSIFKAGSYFFDISKIDELRYNWQVGNITAKKADPTNPHTLNLKIGRVPERITREIKVLVENKDNFAQRAKDNLKVILLP